MLASVIVAPLVGASLIGSRAWAEATGHPAAAPVYQPKLRQVTSWRSEAADHLVLSPADAEALRSNPMAPRVARCVKLNNYWCIKTAGWNGEIAADADGHVAFASAVEGAAVAAILLKRYYVDFNRKTALEIVSHWAPAGCGPAFDGAARSAGLKRSITQVLAPAGIGSTLRARWLASHSRGFVAPLAGRRSTARRSRVPEPSTRMMTTPTIAVGSGEPSSHQRPMTLDALMMSGANVPPSRSMIGMGRAHRGGAPVGPLASLSSCGSGEARVASYAAKASVGISTGPGGDLALFSADGRPTPNLETMMANMARVEIGPNEADAALIRAGIAEAFRPGRNP